MSHYISFILIFILVILIVVIFWFLIINWGSSKLNLTILKLIGVILATSIFIIFDVFSTENEFSKNIRVVLLKDKESYYNDYLSSKLFYIGSEHSKGYQKITHMECFAKKNYSDKQKFTKNSLDLLEVSFWSWFADLYHIHWQVNMKSFHGISGFYATSDIIKGANKVFEEITYETMSVILEDNSFTMWEGMFLGAKLPKGAKLEVVSRDNYKRDYKIETPNLILSITIFGDCNSSTEFSMLGKHFKSDLPKNNIYSENFVVEISCLLKRSKIFSLQTQEQLKWVRQIQNQFYEDFDWFLIKPDLEKYFLYKTSTVK